MELRNNQVNLTEADQELLGTKDVTVSASQIGEVWRAARARLENRRAQLATMDMTPIVGVGWAAMAGAVRPPAFFEMQRNLRQGEQLELLRHTALSVELETLGANGEPLRRL
jgi:hypothetical protein